MAALIFHNGTIDHLLHTYGYAAVFVFVMVESLGVPFPGETMVIAAALYAGTSHRLSVWLIAGVAAGGAIAGDNIGFSIGRWGGYRLLRRYGKYVRIKERRLKIGRYVFQRHGGKVVFFGRFVSILRTYAAFLAGTNRMEWKRFFAFNAAGGIIWALIYSFAYYELGSAIKGLGTAVDIGIGAGVAVIVVVGLVYAKRHERQLGERAEKAFPGPLDDPKDHDDDSGEDPGAGGERAAA